MVPNKNKLTADHIEKMYDFAVTGTQYKNDYEFFRWFDTRSSFESYKMTYFCLKFHLNTIKFKNCLELGPGPGTWTRFFLLRNTNANFTLVDISKEMLNQVKSVLKNPKIHFIHSNFETFKSTSKFDFFFSSRAIEYMPNKKIVVKKIYDLLKNNSLGIIITKNPDSMGRRAHRFLRLKTKLAHTEQIKTEDLVKLLRKQGFKNIEVYPCIVSAVPFFKIHWLNKFLWKKIFVKKLNCISKLFSESYIIKFNKI
ncbi:MAG: class I SAM-dependent methyltransferase [Promethearchaeota archaeon]